MEILVIDGQGGGLGRQLVTAITALCPEAELTAVGSIRKATVVRKEWGTYDGTPYGGFYTQDEIRDVVK